MPEFARLAGRDWSCSPMEISLTDSAKLFDTILATGSVSFKAPSGQVVSRYREMSQEGEWHKRCLIYSCFEATNSTNTYRSFNLGKKGSRYCRSRYANPRAPAQQGALPSRAFPFGRVRSQFYLQFGAQPPFTLGDAFAEDLPCVEDADWRCFQGAAKNPGTRSH